MVFLKIASIFSYQKAQRLQFIEEKILLLENISVHTNNNDYGLFTQSRREKLQ